MVSKVYSRDERMEKMSDLIKGKTLHSRTSSERGASQNLLFGVVLHAAARTSHGKPLSALETRLLAAFSAICDDDDTQEIAHYGSCYESLKEQGKQANTQSIFPDCIVSLSNDEPYTSERFRNDVRRLGPEISAQPNHQTVDLSKPTAGASVDSEEYLAAVVEAGGHGFTVFDAPSHPVSSSSSNQDTSSTDMPYKMRLISFVCTERPDASATDVYWGTAAASDSSLKFSSATDKTLVEEKSATYYIDHVLFDGLFDNQYLVGWIGCFEQVSGESDWLQKLDKELQAIGQLCLEVALEGDLRENNNGETDNDGDVKTMAALAFNLIYNMSEASSQRDDMVVRRGFGWTKRGLEFIKDSPSRQIDMTFHSEIRTYILTVRLELDSGPEDPIGELLTSWTTDGTHFSSEVSVSKTDKFYIMTMATHNDVLYGAFADADKTLSMTMMNEKGNWQDFWTPMNAGRGKFSAVAQMGIESLDGRWLYIFCRGLHDEIQRLKSSNPQNGIGGRWDTLPIGSRSYRTQKGLSLEQRGARNTIAIAVTDPQPGHYSISWSAIIDNHEFTKDFLPITPWDSTMSSPRPITWNGKQLLALATNAKLQLWDFNLVAWVFLFKELDLDYVHGSEISVAVLADDLWVAYHKSAQAVWLSKFTSDWVRTDYDTGYTSLSCPDIHVFEDKFYLTRVIAMS